MILDVNRMSRKEDQLCLVQVRFIFSLINAIIDSFKSNKNSLTSKQVLVSPSATTRASTTINQTGPFGYRLSSARVTPVLSSRRKDKLASPVVGDLASKAISIVGSPFTTVAQNQQQQQRSFHYIIKNAVSPKQIYRSGKSVGRKSMIQSQSLKNLNSQSFKCIKSPQSKFKQSSKLQERNQYYQVLLCKDLTQHHPRHSLNSSIISITKRRWQTRELMSMAMEGDQSLIDKVYIEAHTVMVYYYLDILQYLRHTKPYQAKNIRCVERKLELHHLISNLQEILIPKLRFAAEVNKIKVYEVIWYQNQSLMSSLIEQNRDSTSHENYLLCTLVSLVYKLIQTIQKDLHKFTLLLLTQILSSYNKQKSFYAITLSAYKQVEVQVPSINQTMKSLFLQRLGCTLWDQKPVRKTLNFLMQMLECLQYIINKPEKSNLANGLSKLSDQQIILYQAIIQSFLISHQLQYPLLKVIQSQSPMHYFSIQCQQLEQELEQISHSDPLIDQFNNALHDQRIFLVQKLRDLTGIDLALSKRHHISGLPIFIIPRDSPFQLNFIISLITEIDGVNRLTKLPRRKQFQSKAKFVPYFFKFEQSSAPMDFADNLVQIDNFLNNVVSQLSYSQFVKEFDWKKNIKLSYVNQITNENHPLSQPSPLRKSLDGDLKFASFLTMLRNELVVNGGEAGYRALQFALKDKHYEKLIEHILSSESFMNQAHRHLVVQLLFNLLIVIIREQEFDYKSFCMVAEKIIKIQVKQAGYLSQISQNQGLIGGDKIEDFFTDKSIIWQIRNLNANINKQIFGIKIIPSLSFVRQEMKRVLGYIFREQKLYLVRGLKMINHKDNISTKDQVLPSKRGKNDNNLKLWSFYSPGCNFIYVNEQQINELFLTRPKGQQQIRQFKLKLVKSIVQDIAFTKTSLLSNQYKQSGEANQQSSELKQSLIKGIAHQLALIESVSRLYKSFKSYPPQRLHEYSPIQLAKKRKTIAQQTKSMKKFYELEDMGDKVKTSTALLKEIIKLNKHFKY